MALEPRALECGGAADGEEETYRHCCCRRHFCNCLRSSLGWTWRSQTQQMPLWCCGRVAEMEMVRETAKQAVYGDAWLLYRIAACPAPSGWKSLDGQVSSC